MKRERVIELWLAGFVLVAGLIVVVVLLGTAAADGPPMSERVPPSFSPIHNLLPTNNVYAFGHLGVVGNIIKKKKVDLRCNEKDGCYPYGDGCEERDYYCAGNGTGCNYTFSNRHTDGWVDTGNTRWVDVNKCKEKEQKEQEYRDYKCSAGSCNYSINDTKWIDTGIYNTTCNYVSLAPPEITSFAPLSYVDDTVCNWRTFDVTVNQAVNVSWYLNNTLVLTNQSVLEAKCTLHADVVGEHNVTAIASNANGSDMQMWIWDVTELQKECEGTDTSCGIYPNCGNCNEKDGCYPYGDGCEERDYNCMGKEAGCNYTSSNRHTDGWVDTGNMRWVDVNKCKEKEQKEQQYRDYKCSAGCCHYSINDTKWIDTGNASIKANGTICGCTADNTVKRCYDGNCTDTGIGNSINCSADVACDGKKPDLVIEERYEKGKASSYTVFFVVKNIGTATAPKGHYATLYVDGVEIEKKLVSTDLEQGETCKGSFKTKVELTGEFDNIKVCADNYNNVDELDDANNCQENQWQPVEKQPTDKPPTDKLPTEKPDLVIEEKYEKGKAGRYPVFFVKPVLAQEDYTITIGEDWNVTFTECNYHNSWFEDDPNNPEPWPDQREAYSEGNIAYVSLSATPGHAGVARSRVGVDFEWDLGPYTWEEVKNWPVNVIINFSYHIDAYWTAGNGSANAGVSVDGFLGPCFDEAGYDLIGFETGHSGSRGDTVSETYQTTVEGLEDLGRRIALQACCQAHSVAEGTSTHHSSAEVQISSIKIKIFNSPIAKFTYTPEKPMVGGNIKFNASSSDDPEEGKIVLYEWVFGNGTPPVSAPIPEYTHKFDSPEKYTITLTVTDVDGAQNSTSTELDLSLEVGNILLCRSDNSKVPCKEWTHAGMYVGMKYGVPSVVEQVNSPVVPGGPKGVILTPLSRWSWPDMTYVGAFRVRTRDSRIPEDAADFVYSKLGQPYDLPKLLQHVFFCREKSIDDDSWYCSEIVWAAYMKASNGAINLDHNAPADIIVTGSAVPPDDLCSGPYIELVGEHKEVSPETFWSWDRHLGGIAYCPVDVTVTDPDGLILANQDIQIPSGIYEEVDINGDGEIDMFFILPDPKNGGYQIKVTSEPAALPEDTYSLEVIGNGETLVLAEDTLVDDIPEQPYVIWAAEHGINNAPVASLRHSPESPVVGQEITFDASSSYDLDGEIVSYNWNFGDESIAESEVITHAYTESGEYTVNLTVFDNDLLHDSTEHCIEVKQIPIEPPEITNYAPESAVNDSQGATRTFNITIDQPVNVSWQINGTVVHINKSVTDASYTNMSAVVGSWNVSAIVTNTNGTDMQTWVWNVTKAVGNPDLLITHKWLCWPDNCTICYNVTNIGTGTAPACHNTALYVDGVAVAHDHVPVDLAPGESYTGCFGGYDWTYTPPSDNITVCADNDETLVELDEDNNCLTNIWMCGDVRKDGYVTAWDVAVLNSYVAGIGELEVERKWAGDVRTDGYITAWDVAVLNSRVAGIGAISCMCTQPDI